MNLLCELLRPIEVGVVHRTGGGIHRRDMDSALLEFFFDPYPTLIRFCAHFPILHTLPVDSDAFV